MGVHQFLGEGGGGGGHKKQYIYGEFPKKGGLDNLQGVWGLAKNREEGIF